MRRAAIAVLVGGFASGSIVCGLGQRPAIFAASAAVRVPTADAALAAAFTPVKSAVKAAPVSAMKTVRYRGYQVSVPESWPVYFLDNDPDRCVRYDVSAVYLGTPGTNQDCPAGLAGRADTISIGGVKPPVPSVGKIFQDVGQHELAVATPDAAPAITATYGTDPSVVEQILASVRPAQPAPSGVSHAPAPEPSPSVPAPSPSSAGSSRRSEASASASPAARPSATAGFDTCTAPSLHTMQAWRAKFSATAIYIGGQMMACDYGNLSAGWVRRAEAMGWSLLPTYVGLQAPCASFSGKINPKHAAAQGAAAANRAIADADAFGLGRGSPIYYDMEAYNHTKARCVTAVLTFLDAWTRRLRAQGYVSGVYASAGSAVIDLQTTTRIAGHALAEPQAVWFALWDNAANLTGRPYMTGAVWPVTARSKQYAGPHVVKVAGISLDIDSDLVSGPVARG